MVLNENNIIFSIDGFVPKPVNKRTFDKKNIYSFFIKALIASVFLLTQSSVKPLNSELIENKSNNLRVSLGEEFTLRLNAKTDNKWELVNEPNKEVLEFIKSESKLSKDNKNQQVDYFIFRAKNKGFFRLVSIDSNNKKQYFDIFVE